MKKISFAYKIWFICATLPLLCAATVTIVDPTRPPDAMLAPTKTDTYQPLQLTAIFIYPHSRFAIINAKTVKIGDYINDLLVTSITPFAVELMDSGNNKQELLLAPPILKRRP